MSEAKLQQVLESASLEKCRDFFLGMPEKERRKFAPALLSQYHKADKGPTFNEARNSYSFDNVAVDVLGVAIYSTGTLTEIKKLGWRGEPDREMMLQIILDRRPDWIAEWAEMLLDSPRFPWYWKIVRQLFLEGLIEKPDHPNYTLGMIRALQPPGGAFRKDEPSVEEAISADPTLLEDEVWRLFEHEGAGEDSLANADGSRGTGDWQAALLYFEKRGELSRERLLNSSLDALLRDFNHYRAKWFTVFHDALKPTDAEQKSLADKYLQLLSMSAPPVVSWAYTKVEKLAKKNAYPPMDLAVGIAPVFGARAKGTIKKSLKLLDTVAGKQEKLTGKIAAAALPALGHEEAEVQAAVLAILEKYGDANDPKFVREVAEYSSVVAPSERKRLKAWLAAAGATSQPAAETEESTESLSAVEGDEVDDRLQQLYAIDALRANRASATLEIPAARFDGTELNRLIAREQIRPIEDLDELIEVCSRVVEEDDAIDDFERCVDGISRLCDQEPDDFELRTGPLLKRVTALLKKDHSPFVGRSPGEDLAGLIYAWCTGIVLAGKAGKDKYREPTWFYTIDGEKREEYNTRLDCPTNFLSQRQLAIANRVSEGTTAPLWSTPTHAGAWIDPQVLVERVLVSQGKPVDDADVILAVLRLAPDGRAAALAQLKSSKLEAVQAVRYALGGSRIKIGKSAPLWVAAARSRAPWSDDAAVEQSFPKLGADAGIAAQYRTEVWIENAGGGYKFARFSLETTPAAPKNVDPLLVTSQFHSSLRPPLKELRGRGIGISTLGGSTGFWTASIWPQSHESLFAHANCAVTIDPDLEYGPDGRNILELLFDPTAPLREMGLMLIAISLAGKDPGTSGPAIDVAIAAIEDGRLGSDNFGAILKELLPSGLIKPPRWAKTLAEVARISPLHAAVVQLALQHALVGDANALPRDYAKLMELLLQLSIELELSITQPDCREMLESLQGSGKGPKLAKSLLKLEASPESAPRILDLALQQRIVAVQPQV